MTSTLAGIRIHLADKRKAVRSGNNQTFFSIPLRTDEESSSVGQLKSFSEVTQKPASVLEKRFASGTVCVLPLVGKVVVCDSRQLTAVDVGQLLYRRVPTDGQLTFENEYSSEWISYLVWELDADYPVDIDVLDFDLQASVGRLVSIQSDTSMLFPVTAQVGMFNGRQDEILRTPTPEDKFVFVIEGAFEVQERLLHARDGLSLPRNQLMEFEALSNNAMILVLSAR